MSVEKLTQQNHYNCMRKNLPSNRFRATDALTKLLSSGVIASLLFCISLSTSAQVELVQDINETEEVSFNEFSNLRSIDEKVFFVSEGRELWVTYQDTDENNIDRAEKLGNFTWIDRLYVAGHTLYFIADDGVNGRELWQSNGTADGTFMVKDIYPGSPSSNPENLRFSNNILYFSATSPGMGTELWRSNGSDAGTMMVKDILPKSGSSKPSFLTDVNGTLFFSASDGTNGYELWKSNGTAGGTVMVKDIVPAVKVSSSPKDLVNIDGVLFFTAQESATGRELYKSDGTAAGTMIVKDIWPGTQSSGIENLTSMNGYAVFTANDGSFGHELWRSDGNAGGTFLVKDMTPGAPGSHGETAFSYRMGNFKVINGTLFYTAYQGNDYYTWKSDGTNSGTVALFRTGGPGIGQPAPYFTEMNGSIFFFLNYDGYDNDYSLMRMQLDGSNPRLVYWMYNDTYDYYYPTIVVATNTAEQKQLYTFGTNGWSGINLIRSGGTEETTEELYSLDPYAATKSSTPHKYTHFQGKLLFVADATYYESHSIMSTDGKTVTELFNFQHMSNPDHPFTTTPSHVYGSGRDWLEILKADTASRSYAVTVANDYEKSPALLLTGTNTHVYFTNQQGELWKIDGVTDALSLLKTFHKIEEIKSIGNAIVFRVKTSTNGEEWWRSNGTVSGTYRIKFMRSSFSTPPLVSPSAEIKNAQFFISNNGTHGNEIWRSGGVGSNTYMLADLNPNDAAAVQNGHEYDISSMAAFRDSLYISAIGSNGKWALFKSNGAAGNITKVIEMNAVRAMAPAGNQLFLFVYGDDNRSGLTLWVTNGTAAGTRMVKDVRYAFRIFTYAVGNDLYFSPETGNEMWKSDGTECGTFTLSLNDVRPYELSGLGSNVIFTGYEFDYGYELYKYDTKLAPESPCHMEFAATSFSGESARSASLKSYPNPFVTETAVSIDAEPSAKATISATTITGHPVMAEREFEANEQQRIGADWAPGMYIVKVTYDGKVETRIVVKK